MPFVNELISDDDKRAINWELFKWSKHSYSHDPWKWTIDRERDVFLVGLAGRGREGEHPEVYALSWKGTVIRFSAERGGSGTFTTGLELLWKVFDVDIPPELVEQREEILGVLKEAIDAHGHIYDRRPVKSIHIQFIERPAAQFCPYPIH